MVVTDQEIANGVENLLRQSNPTSINGLVQQLEAKLGLDLSHKITFIRNHIDLLIRSHIRPPPPQSQPQPPTQPPQAQQTNSVKDHFTLQYQAQFHPTHTHTHHHQHLNQHHQHLNQHHQYHQQFSSSHFALPNHHNHRPEELNFRHHHHPNPYTQSNPFLYAHPQQQQPQRVLKSEDGFVGNVATAGAAAGTTAMPKESAPTATKRRGGPGGLTKICGVSPELQAIVGEPALPRTQIVKQLWAYIRKNNLQDPSNKRKIICDEPLRLVFETDCTDMFKMNKLLAKHIIALEPKKETGSDSKRVKVDVEQVEVEQEKVEVEREKVEVESSVESTEAGSSTMVISDALARFLGTEEREMIQSEAVGRVWEHITVNNLTDPIDSMVIICDAKLQELFGCESTSVVGISEMLMSHFFKKS